MVGFSSFFTLLTLASSIVHAIPSINPAHPDSVNRRTFGICDPLGILGTCPAGQTCSIITHTCFGCGEGTGFPWSSLRKRTFFCDDSGSSSLSKRTFLPPCEPSSCQSCPAGQYSSSTDNNCNQCPENTFSAAGASSCTHCPDGQTAPAGSSSCTPSTPQPTGGWSKRLAEACSAGFTTCPLVAGGFECIDITSNLQSCGGCWSEGDGVDCSAFDPKASASCVAGRCQYTCPRGYVLTEEGCEKVANQRNKTEAVSILKEKYQRVLLSV